MKLICPFCKEEVTGPDVPTTAQTALGGTYICHKKICYNKDKHPDKNNVAVLFTPDEEK